MTKLINIYISSFIFLNACGIVERRNPASVKEREISQFLSSGEKRAAVDNVGTPTRMTRNQFEKEARVNDSQDGSLWVMQGQGSYLFSSNTVRLSGDRINIKLEGAAKSDIDTKVKTLNDLILKLEESKRTVASDGQQKAELPQKPEEGQANSGDPQKTGDPAAVAVAGAAKTQEKESSPFTMPVISAQVVERTQEGHYLVKGIQPFTIGKEEFKVLVSGLARSTDINGDEISSDALIEPKLEIVSTKEDSHDW